VTRTALPAGLLAGAALALVAVLVFGLMSRSNQTVGPSASPTSTPIVSPTPSPTASPLTNTQEATAVGSVPNCEQLYGWYYAISGDDMYMLCYDANSLPYIARMNLTTNKVTATYAFDPIFTYAYTVVVEDGYLWYDGSLGSACLVDQCDGFHRTEQINIATGKRTLDLPNWALWGAGFGYIWASETTDLVPKGEVAKLDPATGEVKGRIPFKYDTMQVACGSLWGRTIDDPGSSGTASTTIARLDPTDGHVLATFTEPGRVNGLQQIGSECWASAYTGPSSDTSAPGPNHFVRIGQSGIEFRSFTVPASQGSVRIFDGTFWIVGSASRVEWIQGEATTFTSATMQRIDPATWQPVGPTWTYPVNGGEPLVSLEAAGGSIWVTSLSGSTTSERLDIPLGPIEP
jgi:hypothetical protein